jgi:RecA/RadA recombinase
MSDDKSTTRRERRVRAESPAPAPKAPPVSERSRKMSKVLGGLSGFQLWSRVEAPRILRTRVTSLNRALRCGGIPGGMLGILHGPSQGGKTLLLAEILHAAWATGGWGLFVDAECRGVDLKWFGTICASLDEVAYLKPKTYEECIEKVEVFRRAFREAKEAGDVPPEAFVAIGVDSVNRLTPSTELEEFLKGRVEARGYPLRALMTSKWLDKLVPTLERDEVLAFVQREGKKLDAMPGQKQYTVKGGNAPIYDGGWICRVTSAGHVKVEKGKEEKVLVGEKHEIEVVKNSMGPHLDEVATFYSSVGATDGAPLGLDFAREVREEALVRKLLKKDGNAYLYEGERVAPSKPALLAWLSEDVDGRPRWAALAEVLDAAI